jgi:hypothetical protein
MIEIMQVQNTPLSEHSPISKRSGNLLVDSEKRHEHLVSFPAVTFFVFIAGYLKYITSHLVMSPYCLTSKPWVQEKQGPPQIIKYRHGSPEFQMSSRGASSTMHLPWLDSLDEGQETLVWYSKYR